jgi:hypothetical protein
MKMRRRRRKRRRKKRRSTNIISIGGKGDHSGLRHLLIEPRTCPDLHASLVVVAIES